MEPEVVDSLHRRIERLERRARFTQAASLLGGLGLVVLGCTLGPRSPTRSGNSDPVLRVRAIVLEDEQGRPRILLGAPISAVPGRKRTDEMTGMVVLGPDGSDRLQVGNVGGPQMGSKVQTRMSPATGLMVNDPNGDERGGFGVFENGQVGWGLDFPGGEAIVAAVNPTSGFAGIMISADVEQHRERALFMTDKDGQTLLQLNDASGRSRAVFSVKGGDAPALQAFDDKGGVIRDALAAGKR